MLQLTSNKRKSKRRAALRGPSAECARLSESLETRNLLSVSTAQLTAANDTTIYDVPAGDVANGAGEFLLAGGDIGESGTRRGMVYFDLSSVQIPDGATIIDVVLSMHLSATSGGPASVSVHRVLNAWGEAGSDAPGSEIEGDAAQQFDATWLFSFFDGAAWGSPGGDFAGASAATIVSEIGVYEWVGGDLIADVQAWIDNAAPNFGWMIIGNESGGNNKSFDSRDSANAVLRPTLEITWEETVLPGIVQGRKWHDRDGNGLRLPAAVDDLLLEFHNGNDYFNAFGGQEYWFRSRVDTAWYFLTATGELTKWNGAGHQLTGQSVAQLDSRIYFNTSELTDTAPQDEPWLNGFTFELVDADGLVVQTTTSRDVDLNGDGIIQEEAERGWYRFEGVAPANYTVREVPREGWVQSASRTSPLAADVFGLRSSLGLRRNGSLHVDYGGRGEKWLKADHGWYYILPNGELFQWNGVPVTPSQPLTGSFTTNLGPAYHRDPSLIYAAASPLVTVSPAMTVSNVDFGNYQPAVISGRKWHDRNPDGIRNPPEFRYIDGTDGDGGFNPGGGLYYANNGEDAGDYFVDRDGNVYRVLEDGSLIWFTRLSGAALTEGTPGRWIFFEEEWLNGWTFELLDEAGNVVATSTSQDWDRNQDGVIEDEDEKGWYRFEDLLPGTYTVREVQQAGWIQTAPASPDWAERVTALQNQYGFRDGSKDFFDFGHQDERWLQGRNGEWYFITPDGSLYLWDRNSGGAHGQVRGTLIDRLSSSFYLNPSLLITPVGTTVLVDSAETVDDLNFGNHYVLDGLFEELADTLLANR